MAGATFFGEINELHSRAVWYSDEEDDESDEELNGDLKEVKASCREKEVANTEIKFRLSDKDIGETWLSQITTCMVSVDLAKHNNQRDLEQLMQVATLSSRGLAQTLGTVYSFELEKNGDNLLWLVIDSAHPYVIGQNVGHLVESLISTLVSKLSNLKRILILSQQFSLSEHLIYLVNSGDVLTESFNPVCKKMLPPTLIRNHFEASVFEYSTISNLTCAIFCLPDPKDYWFDSAQNWAYLPKQIIDHRINDNKLDRSYIFI